MTLDLTPFDLMLPDKKTVNFEKDMEYNKQNRVRCNSFTRKR